MAGHLFKTKVEVKKEMEWNLPYGLEHYLVIKHVSYGHCFRYWWIAGMPSEPENIYWLAYRAGPWCTQYSRPEYKEWLTFRPTVKCVPHIRKLLSWMLQFRPTKTYPYVRKPLNSLHSTHLNIVPTHYVQKLCISFVST